MTTNAQTEAREIVEEVQWDMGMTTSEMSDLETRIAAALAVRDAELAEAASALWRIPPNVHTIPCEANGFAEPDPFEGVGETYADAYMREKARAERAEAQLAEAKRFIEMALDYEGDVFGRHHNDVVDLLLPAAPATSKGGANHD